MERQFRGLLESGVLTQDVSAELHWVAVRIPFDPYEAWQVAKPLRVRGTINGFEFRTTLFGSRDNGHLILVNRTMQKQGRAAPGSMAEFTLEPDEQERSADPPAELAKLLKQDRALKKWHAGLNYSMRSWMVYTINKVKSPEARVRAAERIAEQMMLAMEGEEVTPPILQVGFRRQPLARKGWDAMTPIQRRNHLLAIFHCQGTEARNKRTNMAIDDALRRAKKLDDA